VSDRLRGLNIESFGRFEAGLIFLLARPQMLVPEAATLATKATAMPNFDKNVRLDSSAGVSRVNSFGISSKISIC
jgi:hypothetical protein